MRKDGIIYAASDDKGVVKLRDSNRRVDFRQLKVHRAPVYGLDFVPNSSILLTAGDDNLINVFDYALDRSIQELRNQHQDFVRGIAAFQTGKDNLVTGSLDKYIRLFDLRTRDQLTNSFLNSDPVNIIRLFDGDMKVAATAGKSVRIFSPKLYF